MPRRLVSVTALLFLLAWPASAAADITAFIGVSPTPENRAVRGVALGLGVLIIGFEFEYANVVEDDLEASPGLQTGSGNVLIQTPVEFAGFQFYGTVGGGVFRERLLAHQETHFTTNLGGGAKIRLLGPLRLRLDYRVFSLQGSPLHSTYHRMYAGANLAF
jgi:hypothetical protein